MSYHIIPTIPYQDCPAAIDWLEKTFGFQSSMVVPGATEAEVAHAQLTLGGAMIMLHTAKPAGNPEKVVSTPNEVDGAVTTSLYVVVEDIEGHYKHACDAGAEITMPLEDQDYGGAVYVARDPEGHIWSFGSYNPFVAPDGS